MDAITRVEKALAASLLLAGGPECPPRLAAAMQYAVFPRGARIRPLLCLAVAGACGEDAPAITEAASVAIELLHSASLVHDDLPCFDDATMRRGRPSLHRAFGEPLAVLAGDALIVLAFQTIARAAASVPQRMASVLLTVARSVGAPNGISAGQAWECEPHINLAQYQRAKTGALFAAATVAGAAAAGVECEPWRMLGEKLGEAFQVADDLQDVAADPGVIGKPVGRDRSLGRPSAALELGIDGAIERFEDLAASAVAAIPACPGAAELRAVILLQARRLLPKELAQHAA